MAGEAYFSSTVQHPDQVNSDTRSTQKPLGSSYFIGASDFSAELKSPRSPTESKPVDGAQSRTQKTTGRQFGLSPTYRHIISLQNRGTIRPSYLLYFLLFVRWRATEPTPDAHAPV